ncbi:MAG TPA: 2-oxo-4-hydroxy-4-carboxy-5-ureidoimidazoline decarboxylase [Pyrinomonadaceae bacterium]|nr:2-oxo-4-hydroxy-4-carboxy-5-ureidoimidazoline decarboxylase [Pyrinomonadaceae bacterium]
MQNERARPASLAWFNALPTEEAAKELLKCCGSTRWAQRMTQHRPFETIEELTRTANEVWTSLDQADWLEAFHSHPKIGEKKAAEPVSKQSQQWSGQEQAGVRDADQETIDLLAQLNREYEEKFGFIFIVCATGKSAAEMLAILRERLRNEIDAELGIAAAEQAKITELRLKKLVN